MKEELINFETAKLAKEKGFRVATNSFYSGLATHIKTLKTKHNWNKSVENECAAPTQSLLQKWLREKHKLVVFVDFAYGDYGKYSATLLTEGKNKKYIHKVDGFTIYDTYEQALKQGLQEALKLIK